MWTPCPLPMNKKKLAWCFRQSVSFLPSLCHALSPGQTVSVRRSANQPESNSKPSTNQRKVVKRTSNHARKIKVRVYFIVIARLICRRHKLVLGIKRSWNTCWNTKLLLRKYVNGPKQNGTFFWTRKHLSAKLYSWTKLKSTTRFWAAQL